MFQASTGAWLSIGPEVLRACEGSDDAFDALIAAIVARAHGVGRCHTPDPSVAAVARVEGWIALPLPGSLALLAQP